MTLRTRLMSTLFVCLLLAGSLLAFMVFSLTEDVSTEAFEALAVSQLERVEERIQTFIEPGAMGARYLAQLDLVHNSRGKLTSYLNTTETTTLLYANHPPYEQRVYDELLRVHHYNDNFGLVFMANTDGQYAQAPEGHVKTPGYDPRLRSWYKEAMSDPGEVTVTSPYLTTGGGMVCSIMAKTYDADGRPLGLLGVDYSLQSLTEDLADRQILETGYLVLLNADGQIILDKNHPEHLSMSPGQYPTSRKQMAATPNGIFTSIDAQGHEEYIVTHGIELMGWTVAVVFDKSEVMASSYSVMQSVITALCIVFVVMFFALALVARGIVRPIEELTEAATIISGEDYEVTRELSPDLHKKLNTTGSRESQRLGRAFQLMLKNLQHRIETAVAASNAKSAFLSNMSHEMRTPMNAIIGMTTIGKNAHTPGRKDYAFEKIEDASMHLLGVINDVLDMSKIEADKMELSPAAFDFERMLRKVMNVVNFRVEEKRQAMAVYIDPRIPKTLVGDDQRLSQVMANLLSNAVKFTPEEGAIQFAAHLMPSSGDSCLLRISVRDNGIGISKEQQARLFSSFVQAENDTSRRFGGTGLGLAISQHIVRMMNGRIWIESELGKGSTFSFEVRLKPGTLKGRDVAAARDRSHLRVLVICSAYEPGETCRQIVADLGAACHVATGAEDALAFIRQNGRVDVCIVDASIIDAGITDANPADARTANAGLVPQLKAGGCRYVAMMVSSSEWSNAEGDGAGDGIDRYLQKPLFPSAVAECLDTRPAECVSPMATTPDAPDASDEACYRGRRVLLAEDVDINREIVQALLEPTQVTLDFALNGAEAVAMVAADPQAYHLILMDIQMPEMDGYEATARIRAMEREAGRRRMPIVAMTANAFREDIERCLAVGMDGHISKPIDYDEMLVKLHPYLAR